MNVKQAISQTQQRWLGRIRNGQTAISCGFCDHADGECDICLVPKVLGFRCENLPSYCHWINSIAEPSTGLSHCQIKDAANEVLADVNQIARVYHVKQVKE
jgi:hypothetical protein